MSELVLLFLVSALYLALGVWVIRRTSESSTGKARPVNISGIPEFSPIEIFLVALKNVLDTTIELKNIVSTDGKIVIQFNIGIKEISAFFQFVFFDISGHVRNIHTSCISA